SQAPVTLVFKSPAKQYKKQAHRTSASKITPNTKLISSLAKNPGQTFRARFCPGDGPSCFSSTQFSSWGRGDKSLFSVSHEDSLSHRSQTPFPDTMRTQSQPGANKDSDVLYADLQHSAEPQQPKKSVPAEPSEYAAVKRIPTRFANSRPNPEQCGAFAAPRNINSSFESSAPLRIGLSADEHHLREHLLSSALDITRQHMGHSYATGVSFSEATVIVLEGEKQEEEVVALPW
ncbi:hypothetical protein KIL84_010005, partial [Mauremys mutica]